MEIGQNSDWFTIFISRCLEMTDLFKSTIVECLLTFAVSPSKELKLFFKDNLRSLYSIPKTQIRRIKIIPYILLELPCKTKPHLNAGRLIT
jgi:hypothetical protein